MVYNGRFLALVLACGGCGAFSGSDVGAQDDGGLASDAGIMFDATSSTTDGGSAEAGATNDGGPAPGADTVLVPNVKDVVALASDGTTLFWAGTANGHVGAIPVDASSNPSVICDTKGTPHALAFGQGLIFWTMGGMNGFYSSTKAGGCPAATGTSAVFPRAIAVGGSTLYFVTSSGTDGTGVGAATIATGTLAVQSTVSDVSSPIDIVSDGKMGYWLDTSSCAVQSLSSAGAAGVVIAKAGNDCRSLAVASGVLYWTSHADGIIYTHASNGSGVTTAFVQGEADLGPVVADAGGVYWLDMQHGTLRTKTAGKGASVAAGDDQTGYGPRFKGLALDGKYVYRVSYAEAAIKRWRRP